MKTRFLLIAICVWLGHQNTMAQQKAVFIIVDGIPFDVIQKLKPAVLTEIGAVGGFEKAHVGGEKGAYSESPTISAVGYNHVLTGTWTNKHNVWDNDIKDPNYNYWNIFRIAKATKPSLKSAIFSTWQDNRTKLVGDNLPKAGSLKIDYAYDGFELDTVRFPHRKDRKYIADIDELVSKEAARFIASDGPDLSWVYLEFTDDMGHGFGDSPQFYDAIKRADQQIGLIWNAIREREKKFNEHWLIAITTDHGRDAKTGKDHGGQSDRERDTWIVTNAKELNNHFHNGLAAVDIAPTILRHLQIEIPPAVREEMDGVPFIGKNSLDHLKAVRQAKGVEVTWECDKSASGEVDILLSTSNDFSQGRKDNYQKVGKAKVTDKKFFINLSTHPSFYKILVKGKDNWVNTWIVTKL